MTCDWTVMTVHLLEDMVKCQASAYKSQAAFLSGTGGQSSKRNFSCHDLRLNNVCSTYSDDCPPAPKMRWHAGLLHTKSRQPSSVASGDRPACLTSCGKNCHLMQCLSVQQDWNKVCVLPLSPKLILHFFCTLFFMILQVSLCCLQCHAILRGPLIRFEHCKWTSTA